MIQNSDFVVHIVFVKIINDLNNLIKKITLIGLTYKIYLIKNINS